MSRDVGFASENGKGVPNGLTEEELQNWARQKPKNVASLDYKISRVY